MTLNFFLATLAASLLGVHATYWLTHKRQMNSIRAASLSSLIFVLIAQGLDQPLLLTLQPAFFGSTYVAMSEPYRLSEKYVLAAGVVFGVLLCLLQSVDFLHFHGGLGGTLGGTAFLACLVVYWLQRLVTRSKAFA